MTSYIIGMIFGSLILLVGFVFILIRWKTQRNFLHKIKEIGKKAEDKINSDIQVWAKKTKNIFIPAGLYKYSQNKVFEVDSILMTSKALIVVEIKSIKGGIRGDANSSYWKKILDKSEFNITNPIFQNERHIEHIIKMINAKIPTVSLVVYSNRANYLDIKNIPSHAVVIKHSDLFDTLDSIDQSLPLKINEFEMKTLVAMIKKNRTNSFKDKKLHKNITTKGHS